MSTINTTALAPEAQAYKYRIDPPTFASLPLLRKLAEAVQWTHLGSGMTRAEHIQDIITALEKGAEYLEDQFEYVKSIQADMSCQWVPSWVPSSKPSAEEGANNTADTAWKLLSTTDPSKYAWMRDKEPHIRRTLEQAHTALYHYIVPLGDLTNFPLSMESGPQGTFWVVDVPCSFFEPKGYGSTWRVVTPSELLERDERLSGGQHGKASQSLCASEEGESLFRWDAAIQCNSQGVIGQR